MTKFSLRVNKYTRKITTGSGNCFHASHYGKHMANSEAIEKLKAVMEETGKSVEDIFNEMDTDGDGLINGPELFKGVKKLIGQTLSPDQISMMIMAIDTNEDNRIGLPELQKALS